MIINITQGKFFYTALILYLYLMYRVISKNKHREKVNELILLLFGIYIIKVLSLVVFPILITIGSNSINISPTVWFNPIKSILYIVKSNTLYGIIYNIGGNIALLMPLPIFLVYFFKDKVDSLKRILLICFFLSLSIECIQYLESIIIPSVGRFIETNDVILNTTGGMLGYLLYNRYLRKLLNKYIWTIYVI